jgi:ATP-dependent DNA ligase
VSFSFIEPMMALRVCELPAGNWLYEMKFDGYRALAFKAGKEAILHLYVFSTRGITPKCNINYPPEFQNDYMA